MAIKIKLKPTSRLSPFYTLLFTVWCIILSLLYLTNIRVVSGQAIIPLVSRGNDLILRSFLEPCETITLQTQCSDDEYESNEDCLPQKTDNCNHSKELFCLSGVCLPNCHPHKELYDPIEGKCFRKVGSDCRVQNGTTTTRLPPQTSSSSRGRTGEDNVSSINSFEDSRSTSTNEKATEREQQQHLTTTTISFPDCEKNAVCERGQCRCARNFTYDHNFNKCVLYAGYMEYCNDVLNCDRKSDIVCMGNQCQCKSQGTQYFHLKRKRCYIRVGQVCSSGLQFCPDNSNCVRERSSSSIPKNSSIIFSTHETQHSRNDHQLFRLYQDLLMNGEIREGNDDDGELEHFIGIVGDEDESREFTCKCDKGYGSTRDKRFCLGLHGARCNTLYRCNIERGLKCFNGTCLCERERMGEEVYSETFQTCITSIGAPCNGDGEGEREPDICPAGASCKEGKCICDDGLTVSSSRATMSSPAYTCMKPHGMTCKNNNVSDTTTNSSSFPFHENDHFFEPPCNFELGLECSTMDEKCLCKDSNQFYDMTIGKCKKFGGIDQKIPVIHFTPPDDREYAFKKNSAFHPCSKLDLNMMIRTGILCSIVLFFKPVLLFLL